MQLLVVHLMSSCCVRRGLRLVHHQGGDVESNVFVSLVHTCAHTFKKKKKKIALVI
jgi:hypothetical protein